MTTDDDKVTEEIVSNKVTVRFPPATMRRLMHDVTDGKYMSVSDAVRYAVWLMYIDEDRRRLAEVLDETTGAVSPFPFDEKL